MTGREHVYARRELTLAGLVDLQVEPTEQTTQAEFDIAHLVLQLFASHDECPHVLRRRRLAVDWVEPAHAQQLGDAAHRAGPS
ncbi:hypothetical protein JO965_41385 (plasmid) [Microvirga sp. VF16]|nr:hypothetical protein JO965_41385 [Microvirga sp. VF16]